MPLRHNAAWKAASADFQSAGAALPTAQQCKDWIANQPKPHKIIKESAAAIQRSGRLVSLKNLTLGEVSFLSSHTIRP